MISQNDLTLIHKSSYQQFRTVKEQFSIQSYDEKFIYQFMRQASNLLTRKFNHATAKRRAREKNRKTKKRKGEPDLRI